MTATITQATSEVDRLMLRVEIQTNDCWHWTGYIDPNGYGRLGFRGSRSVLAHRVAYTLLVDEIPDGMTTDHLCHTDDTACAGTTSCLHRRCVNPDHLELVTPAENTRRGGNGRKTHCKRGHEFTPANTYTTTAGGRSCVACMKSDDGRRRRNEASKRYKARKAAERNAS